MVRGEGWMFVLLILVELLTITDCLKTSFLNGITIFIQRLLNLTEYNV